jgi:hypothetical protein
MSTDAVSPLRQCMIEDMSARKLNPSNAEKPSVGLRVFLRRYHEAYLL